VRASQTEWRGAAAGGAHQKHGRAVAIAARRLPAVAHILPTVVGAAQRVDLVQVVRRALGLGLDDAGEGGGEEDLHHGALRGKVPVGKS
jgi:hypothetical protein